MSDDARNEGAWTVEKVAEYCGLHPQTVYTKARHGEIPSYKIGRALRFRPDEVRTWLASQKAEPVEKGAA